MEPVVFTYYNQSNGWTKFYLRSLESVVAIGEKQEGCLLFLESGANVEIAESTAHVLASLGPVIRMTQPEFPEVVAVSMAKLISDLKAALQAKNDKFIREIVICSNKNPQPSDSNAKPRVALALEDYSNLLGQLDVLENYGYLRGRPPTLENHRIYRMTEEFVKAICN